MVIVMLSEVLFQSYFGWSETCCGTFWNTRNVLKEKSLHILPIYANQYVPVTT